MAPLHSGYRSVFLFVIVALGLLFALASFK